MRQRRGFTLVEVLVAIGLLVLIAALALPVALTNTTGARAQTAERQLRLSPSVARAEAQVAGVPVGLMLQPSDDARSLSVAIVREPDMRSDRPADLAADPDDVATWPTVAEPEVLPRGTRLWDGELDALDDALAELDSPSPFDAALEPTEELFADARPSSFEDEAPEPIVLAWFLSDGSAIVGQPAAVRLADGRVLRVRVEALAGTIEYDLIEVESDDEPATEPEDDDSEAEDPSNAAEGAREAGSESGRSGGRTAADPLRFDSLDFERRDFESREFETRDFERRDFGSRDFDPLGFEERGFEDRSFEDRAFERRDFEQREFDPLEFDDLGSRFSDPDSSSSDTARPPRPAAKPEEAQPQPPQPR